MIHNVRVLQDDFVPEDVRHRGAEVNHLSDTLCPSVVGDRPAPSVLYGPSGAGKTSSSKHTLRQLRPSRILRDVATGDRTGDIAGR